ncbi:MAG: response regulator transcription factor [Alphaproteobacteria bacterium]|nr:response regulator transcription factor [Alphaproteobacteria bacterium]
MHFLVIEDNRTLARALKHHFNDLGHAVTCVDDGELGVQFLTQENCDCCILDLNLPSMSGLEVLEKTRLAGVQTPVIVLTARDELADRIKGLDGGADDYLTKPFEMDELDARIRALLRRRPQQASKTTRLGQLTIHHDGRFASHHSDNIPLSRKEFAALEALNDSREQLMPKSRLISQIYGVGAEINDATVEVLVSRLRKKLKPYAITIKTVRGVGYYLEEQD